MISRLSIKNYVLIDNLNIDFEQGLNILSGETGAGKSVVISALSFVLGARSDKNIIMPGCEFCRVDIEFLEVGLTAQNIMQNLGFELDTSLVISRKLFLDGKNEIRINGQLANLSMLKQITQNLLEIYGQHAYQVLLDESKHIDFVDSMIKDELQLPLQTLKILLEKQKEAKAKLENICSDDMMLEREKQMLKYQIEEITSAQLKENEDVLIQEQLNKMKHTQKIVENLQFVINILEAGEGARVLDNLFDAQRKLGTILGIDKAIDGIEERIKSVNIELDDISSTLNELVRGYDFSDSDFNQIDARMDLINSLKRKFGPNLCDVVSYLDKAKLRLDELENSDELIAQLKQELISLETQINDVCNKLTTMRKQASLKLEKSLLFELEELGMKDSQFVISIEPCSTTLKGSDFVTFKFCANKGQKLMPLAKVISGGEMSRFMLAFDIIFGLNKFGTLVFDEIDTGISGEVSHLVAQKMYELSKTNQIIAITHLPAICAMADVNFKVEKSTINEKTLTTVKKLDYQQNIKEIARLTGVVVLSQIALKNAEELKMQCSKQKL